MLNSIDAIRTLLKTQGIIKMGGAPDERTLNWRSVDTGSRDSRMQDLLSVMTMSNEKIIEILVPAIILEMHERTANDDIIFKMALCDPNVFPNIFKIMIDSMINRAQKLDINEKIKSINIISDVMNRFKLIIKGGWDDIPAMTPTVYETVNTSVATKKKYKDENNRKAMKCLTALANVLINFMSQVDHYHQNLVNNDGPVQRAALMQLLKLHHFMKKKIETKDDEDQTSVAHKSAANQKEFITLLLSAWTVTKHDGIDWVSVKSDCLPQFLDGDHPDYQSGETIAETLGISSGNHVKFEAISCNLETAEHFFPLLINETSGLFKIHSELDCDKSTVSALRGFSVYFHSYLRWFDYVKMLFDNLKKNPDHHLHDAEYNEIELIDPMILAQMVMGKYTYDLIWDGSSFTTISHVVMRAMDNVMYDLMIGAPIDATNPVLMQSGCCWSLQELFCPIRRVNHSSSLNSLIVRVCFQDYRTTASEMRNHTVEIEGITMKKILHIKIIEPGLFALVQLGYDQLDSVYDSGLYSSVNKWSIERFGVFISSLTNVGYDDVFKDVDFNFDGNRFVDTAYHVAKTMEYPKNKHLIEFCRVFPRAWFIPVQTFYSLSKISEHLYIPPNLVDVLFNYGYNFGSVNKEFVDEFTKRLALSKLLSAFSELMSFNSIVLKEDSVVIYDMIKRESEVVETNKKKKKDKKEVQKEDVFDLVDVGKSTVDLARIALNQAFTQNLLRLNVLANKEESDSDGSTNLEAFSAQKAVLVKLVMSGDFITAIESLRGLVNICRNDIVLLRRLPEIILPVTGLLDDFTKDELSLSFKTK